MSFLATLTIEDEVTNVLECSFDFTQSIGHDGRPEGMPRAGLIHLLLEATGNTDILAWMVMPNTFKDGEIVFYNRDSMSSNKTLTFNDGICVSYHEEFNANDTHPMKTRISISARAMDINDVSYENQWDPFQ
ncbi:type VI secretion system tube protein TssD [Pareuzebyella sediminis]|uniref:type VI secretion system tube protein TssD n=1 Tax=Pareuzebyella sediminis TaxID=2607998 RepID=UPI0011ECBF28|nr:type VI secretion system tube protein TssD [Pareuzebyella sediminis]